MSRFFGPQPRWVVHPALFGAAYVLNLALSNQIVPEGFLRPLVVAVVCASLLMLLGRLLLGNRWDGALLASGAIALVVSPVPLGWLLFQLHQALGAALGTAVSAALLIALLAVVSVDSLRRRNRGLPVRHPSAETLQILSIALVVAVVVSSLLTHPMSLASETAEVAVREQVARPDIVIVLLDGYPRHDVLQRRIGVDDNTFLDGLRQRGFDVATNSRSNYMHTSLTLASMFQMLYVDEIDDLTSSIGSDQRHLGLLRDAAENGEVFSILKGAGYRVVLSTPGWEHVTFRHAADQLLDSGGLSDLEISLLNQTWLLYVIDAVSPNLFTTSLRDRIVHSFDDLDAFASQEHDQPTFFFLHVPAPHLPLVVLGNGKAANLSVLSYEKEDRAGFGMTDQEYAQAWAAELAYIDGRVLNGIDRIMTSPRGRDSVVVVMADHGYNFEVRQDDPEARIGALFAARTPASAGLLAQPPTPVNLFRTLFNHYFGTRLEILPRRYFISDWRTPLQLVQLQLQDVAEP